jgi:hypothetical protein
MTPSLVEQKWHWLALRTTGQVQINLQVNGIYVAAVQNGGGDVYANGTVEPSWQLFTLIKVDNDGVLKHGDQVYIRTSNDYYLILTNNIVKATAKTAAAAAKFTLEKIRGWGEIQVGEPVVIRASNGNIVQPSPTAPRPLEATQSTLTDSALFTITYVGGGKNGPLGDKSTFGLVNHSFESPEAGRRHPIQEAHIQEQLKKPDNKLKPEQVNTHPVGNDGVPYGWDVLAFRYKDGLFKRPSTGWGDSPVRIVGFDNPGPWALPRLNEPGYFKFPGNKTFHIHSDTHPIEIEIGQRFNVPGRPRLGPGRYRFTIRVRPRSWAEGGGGATPEQDKYPTEPKTSQVMLFGGSAKNRAEGPIYDATAVKYGQWTTIVPLEFEVTAMEEVHVGILLRGQRGNLLRYGWYLDEATLEPIIPPECDHGQRYHFFEKGIIFEKPNGEQYALWDDIFTRWQILKAECDFMGDPIADQAATREQVNYAHFEHGSIYQAPTHNAQEIYEDFQSKWYQFGNFPALPYLVRLKTYLGDALAYKDNTAAKPWVATIFSLEKSDNIPLTDGDTLFIRTLNQYYLTASNLKLTAVLPTGLPTPQETFSIVKINGGGEIFPGDFVAIKTHQGNYFSVGQHGLEIVTASGASVKEVFTFEFLGMGRHNVLGYPINLKNDVMEFEHGSLQRNLEQAELSIFQQNMALLPDPDVDWNEGEKYAGTDQAAAAAALIDYLCGHQPAFVGLSECFVATTKASQPWSRQIIKSQLRKIYPNILEGPQEGNNFIPQNAGLLLLSKHPIVASHHTIYRHYSPGTHPWSVRGALHAQIRVANQYDMDVFLTQMPDGTGDIRARQLDQLASFIHAHREPDRPTLLMGDLEVDAFGPLFEELARSLKPGINLWNTGNHDSFTANAPENTFRKIPQIPPPAATRPDYFIIWPGDKVETVYTSVEIINDIKTRPDDRPVSDHYGLRVAQTHRKQWTIVINQPPPQQVVVKLKEFHCLTRTPGATDDHPVFALSRASEPEIQSVPVTILEDGYKEIADVITLKIDTPPDAFEIRVTGQDQNPLDTERLSNLPHEALGTTSWTIDTTNLIRLAARPATRVLPLTKVGQNHLNKDIGEYVVELEIDEAKLFTS